MATDTRLLRTKQGSPTLSLSFTVCLYGVPKSFGFFPFTIVKDWSAEEFQFWWMSIRSPLRRTTAPVLKVRWCCLSIISPHDHHIRRRLVPFSIWNVNNLIFLLAWCLLF